MKLQHPNIVRLYDFGQDKNLLFMVLDFIDGRTLKSEIFQLKGPYGTMQDLAGDGEVSVKRSICSSIRICS